MKVLIYITIFISFISCVNGDKVHQVNIDGRKLLVNETEYLIKGVCYHPVPKGETKRSFESLDQDIELMLEAGVNTVRVYEPIQEKEVLDQLAKSGIKVIIGFGFNQNGNFDILSGTYLNYIENFKNHSAILLWELGNEYNYHPEWFDGDMKNWYTAMNNAAIKIHEMDTNHPVSTAHGELPDSLALAMCPDIDVWGMNVYRWDAPETIFSQWEIISSKPMFLSEAGADSYMTIDKDGYAQGENEKAQADATKNILEQTFQNKAICSGMTLFAFTDELWKAGNPNQYDKGGWAPNSSGVPYDGTPNEEYWGIIDINKKKKEAYEVVKSIYNKN